jgi:hypothetical protein
MDTVLQSKLNKKRENEKHCQFIEFCHNIEEIQIDESMSPVGNLSACQIGRELAKAKILPAWVIPSG